MDATKEFEKLKKKVDKLIKQQEKQMSTEYKEALKEVKVKIATMYEKYEVDGKLTFEEMTKFDRLQKLDAELQAVVSDLYKGNTKFIEGTLKGIAADTYNNTISIVEGATERKLKGIVKELQVDKVINNEMAGLHWGERVGKHRSDLIYNVKKEVTQGLTQGDTYSAMSKRLQKELEVSAGKANVIVRTEGHRVFAETQRGSLDSIANHGVQMVKTWKTAADERVRGNNPKDTMDHVSMDGVTIPLKEDFILPDGSTGYGPGLTNSKNDINCRCIIVIDIEVDEETGTTAQVIMEGQDLTGEYIYDPKTSEFEHDIEDIIHKQGFDGKPQIVDEDTFMEAVEESNFYGERSYSADSPELLEEYRRQLYEGKFYVDCSTGGAQYGQGMYTAAVHDIGNSDAIQGITSEMSHYIKLGKERGFNHAYTEAMTLQPGAKILTIPYESEPRTFINKLYDINYYQKHANPKEMKLVTQYEKLFKDLEFEKTNTRGSPAKMRAAKKKLDNVEYKLDNSAVGKALQKTKNYIGPDGRKGWKDIGTLSAEMGYDAINAEGHGLSGSYTVILNRTKVIIKEGGVSY